jgi:hypothetical protein
VYRKLIGATTTSELENRINVYTKRNVNGKIKEKNWCKIEKKEK